MLAMIFISIERRGRVDGGAGSRRSVRIPGLPGNYKSRPHWQRFSL